MDDDQLLVDFYQQANRLGPGGALETELALRLARVDPALPLEILDVGCGTGAGTLLLAQHLNAHITAVDLFEAFLDKLKERATDAGLNEQITTRACSMDDLPFADEAFDLIWSEGAIYQMGFEKGVTAWRRLLKPTGLLIVSEITWLTDERPVEIEQHWTREYPEIAVASAKVKTLEQHGYSPLGYFVLPEHCWLDHYYHPLQARFDAFLHRHGNSEEARALVAAEQQEMKLFEQYQAYYGYGVYVARKTDVAPTRQ